MDNIVLIGGNGYVGSEVTKQWLERDKNATFFVVGRHEGNTVNDPRVKFVQQDASDYDALNADLPKDIKYIVVFTYNNMDIIKNVKKLAESHNTEEIGYINATTAPEDFMKMKADELKELQTGSTPVVVVDASAIWGNGRNDDIGKMIKAGKLDAMKPINVKIVAELLIDDMTKAWLA